LSEHRKKRYNNNNGVKGGGENRGGGEPFKIRRLSQRKWAAIGEGTVGVNGECRLEEEQNKFEVHGSDDERLKQALRALL